MSCAWPKCDGRGTLRNVEFPDTCRVLSICDEHLSPFVAQLRQDWQSSSDAGDLDATIALILLDQPYDQQPANRPGLRALAFTIRQRNWGQLKRLARASVKRSSATLRTTVLGVLIGVLGISLLALLGVGIRWGQANPDAATTVGAGAIALIVLSLLFKLIVRLTRKWGRPVPYLLAIVIVLAFGSWLAALVVAGICILLEIAISLQRLVKLAEDRQRHQP